MGCRPCVWADRGWASLVAVNLGRLPTDTPFTSVSVNPVEGWKAEVLTGDLPKPVTVTKAPSPVVAFRDLQGPGRWDRIRDGLVDVVADGLGGERWGRSLHRLRGLRRGRDLRRLRSRRYGREG
jgi:hypothetical protein